jgi:chromosomal replication initiation ATPase DnaA
MAKQILVNAPSRFVADWVRGKFLHDIELLARDFFQEPPPIQLLVVRTTANTEFRRRIRIRWLSRL